MAPRKRVRIRSRRSPARGRRSSAAPEPINIKTATFVDTIRILSYPVNVFKAAELEGNALGTFYPDELEIYVQDDNAGAVATADRLLHEVLHAISNIALTVDDRLTERQVNTLSMVLMDTLLHNPQLLRLLNPTPGG